MLEAAFPGLWVSAQPSAATNLERSEFMPIEMESPMTRYWTAALGLAGVLLVFAQVCTEQAQEALPLEPGPGMWQLFSGVIPAASCAALQRHVHVLIIR